MEQTRKWQNQTDSKLGELANSCSGASASTSASEAIVQGLRTLQQQVTALCPTADTDSMNGTTDHSTKAIFLPKSVNLAMSLQSLPATTLAGATQFETSNFAPENSLVHGLWMTLLLQRTILVSTVSQLIQKCEQTQAQLGSKLPAVFPIPEVQTVISEEKQRLAKMSSIVPTVQTLSMSVTSPSDRFVRTNADVWRSFDRLLSAFFTILFACSNTALKFNSIRSENDSGLETTKLFSEILDAIRKLNE
jgi:hypothetical protein